MPNFKLGTSQIPVRTITIWASLPDINMMKWLIRMHTDAWHGTGARHFKLSPGNNQQYYHLQKCMQKCNISLHTPTSLPYVGKGTFICLIPPPDLCLEYSCSSVHITFQYLFKNKTKPYVSTMSCEKFVEHDKHTGESWSLWLTGAEKTAPNISIHFQSKMPI